MRALVVLALASCVDTAPAFHCMDNSACVDAHGQQGQCELTHNCSYPDQSCDGFRYADTADPGRAGICVLSPGGVGMTAPQPVGAGSAVAFEITTPMQSFTFDTAVGGTDAITSLHWFVGPCPPTTMEQQPMPQPCMSGNPASVRITVAAPLPSPSPYCLVAVDQGAAGHVGIRVFPGNSGSGVPCVE